MAKTHRHPEQDDLAARRHASNAADALGRLLQTVAGDLMTQDERDEINSVIELCNGIVSPSAAQALRDAWGACS